MNQADRSTFETKSERGAPAVTRRLVVLKASLAALPRPVWVLCAGTFVNRFGGFVVPFLTLYMTRQGFTVAETSAALVAYGTGHFIAAVLGGYLADRIGRRNTIVWSMFSAAVSLLLLSQARGLAGMVVMSGLVGLAAEFYRPACGALLADLVPAGQRVTAYATYRLAINAGWAFGPATAGFLAEHSFLWLFLGNAITSVVFGVVSWFALPHGLRSPPGERSQGWRVLRTAVRDERLSRLLVSSLAVALVFFQMSSTYGLQVTQRGFSEATYGMLISLNGVLVVLFELPLTTLTQRMPIRRMIAAGYLLIGLGFALNAFASGVPTFALAIMVFTVGEMISMPVAAAYLADLAPAEFRGRYVGLFQFTWSVALVGGPSLGMLLFSWSPFWLWMSCGLLGALAAFVILQKNRSSPDSNLTLADDVER
jgi:MFS family permease